MSSQIAMRHYTLEEDGKTSEVTVRIFQPEPYPDGKDYKCRIRIEWPSKTQNVHAGGIDSVQALVLALQTLGTMINCSEAAKEGKLVWHMPGGGFGLPVPRNIEDILQGDDRPS